MTLDRKIGLCALAFLALAGCTSTHGPQSASAPGFAGGLLASVTDQPAEGDIDLTPTVQPRLATYRCEDGTSLKVENLRTAVNIVDAEGESFMLPASPENQISRYGQTPTSLVLDGSEALYMKGRNPPVGCKR